MAEYCNVCNKKLGLFSTKYAFGNRTICEKCKKKNVYNLIFSNDHSGNKMTMYCAASDTATDILNMLYSCRFLSGSAYDYYVLGLDYNQPIGTLNPKNNDVIHVDKVSNYRAY